MISKKAVFTDIDGTLLEGFITVDFVKYLWEKGLFDNKYFIEQKELMDEFKLNKIDFVSWLKKWAIIWAKGVKGKKEADILFAAKEFFVNFKKNIYPSSKELVTLFHNKGYVVIGVSVGVVEAINLVKSNLNLDYVLASKVEIKNGVYSDKVLTNFHSKEGKQFAIFSFCKENDIDLSYSIGIGDTVHDEQIFEIVGKRIALNPTKELVSVANDKGYLIANHEDILEKIKSFI